MNKEAMTLAVEALEQMQAWANFECWNLDICDQAIKALEEALAKQEQGEPVAQCTNSDTWNCKYCRKTETCKALKDQRNFGQPKQEQGEPDKYVMDIECTKCGAKQSGILTVNTTPQPAQKPWIGLTDDEINQAYAGVYKGIPLHESIEAKLKEKNT